MEKINFYRKIKCSICNSKLLSVYVRGKKFVSLPNYHYCEKCKKVFKLDTDDKSKVNNNKIVE